MQHNNGIKKKGGSQLQDLRIYKDDIKMECEGVDCIQMILDGANSGLLWHGNVPLHSLRGKNFLLDFESFKIRWHVPPQYQKHHCQTTTFA